MGLFDTNPIGGSTANRNPQLYTPINFQNLGTGSTTSAGSTGGSASSASNTPLASTSSASNALKNDGSGLNELLGLASQGAQIAGTIKNQRQQSGASARRQSLIAQCGRKPLFGRERKNEYRKCKADYEAGMANPIGNVGEGSDGKSIGGGADGGSSMKFIWIGLALAVAGGLGYMLYKKSK